MHVVTIRERAQPAVGSALVGTLGVVSTAGVWGPIAASILVTIALATWAATIDARSGRIPNDLVMLAGVPTLIVLLVAIGRGTGVEVFGSVLLGAVAFAGPIFMLHVVSPSAIGFGDVKLAAALGAALGLVEPGLGLLALCIGSAVTTVVALLGRRRTLAFGPGLVFGTVAALLLAARLGEAGLR